MSSYVAAHIIIGGPIKRTLLHSFFSEVHNAGAGLVPDEPFNENVFYTEDELIAALDGERLLHLYDHQAHNGSFEELETFLRAQDVSYIRYGDACPGEYDAEVCFFEAGDDGVTTFVTDDQGNPIIHAIAAVVAYRALITGNVHAALTSLEPYEGYEVPTLPPLEVADGET